jgi:hypothetical protein
VLWSGYFFWPSESDEDFAEAACGISTNAMSGYGRASLTAAKSCRRNPELSPVDAWEAAVEKEFASASSRDKPCPRGAFLGLCEAGLVSGIPVKSYTASVLNKGYATAAVKILRKHPELAGNLSDLWRRVSQTEHNHQMDVVVTLWNAGFIADQPPPVAKDR